MELGTGLQPPVSAAAPSFSGHAAVPSLSPPPLSLTCIHCGAEWSIPQKGQVPVHNPQMEQTGAVWVREGLKKSLKPPWMHHLVAHFTVHRAF